MLSLIWRSQTYALTPGNDRMKRGSRHLYGVDFARDLKSKRFPVGAKRLALPLREFAQQIRVGGNLAPRKYGKTYRIGHSATDIDQGGQIPRVLLLPCSMMLGEDDLKVGRQFPVRNEMPACITMVKSE